MQFDLSRFRLPLPEIATPGPMTWRGAIGDAIKAALAPPDAVLGDGTCRIGDAPPFALNAVEEDVLRALIALGGAANLSDLRRQSECDAPHKVLRQICRNYPALAGYVHLPPAGKKSRGGYATTVKLAKK